MWSTSVWLFSVSSSSWICMHTRHMGHGETVRRGVPVQWDVYIYLATDSMPTQGYTGPSTRDIQKTKNEKKTHDSCDFSRSVGRMSTLQASLYIFSGTHIPCGRFSANRIHRTVQVVIYAYLSGQVDSSHVWPNSCRRDGSSITWIICCSTRCMPSGLNLYHKDLAQLLLSVGENLIDL